jgi:hypothetical protein
MRSPVSRSIIVAQRDVLPSLVVPARSLVAGKLVHTPVAAIDRPADLHAEMHRVPAISAWCCRTMSSTRRRSRP